MSDIPITMTRPPIIVILGHVDHGKTTLLDRLRKTSVAFGEPGGITQTIGAFKIGVGSQESGVRSLTFIDTPGHEAFSKMRSRGAKIADIALLVVAADDGIKPQTIESLSLIQSANITFIVCINKIDLPDINLVKLKQDLAKHGAAVEGFGGTIPVVEISAKTGQNLPELLEMINLVWELQQSSLQPPASSLQQLEAPVIDSRLDPRAGPIANVIVRQGTLHLGDQIVTADSAGKVKSLINDRGQPAKQALPGDPVQVLGLKSVPPIGSILTHSSTSDKHPISSIRPSDHPTIRPSDHPANNVILKADSAATLETLVDVITSLPEPKFTILSVGVGDVTASNILLAGSSKAAIIGFRVSVSKKRLQLAENEGVSVITDNIIYRLLEQIANFQKPAVPQLPPEIGRAKIVKIFTVNGVAIAGCIVESGKLEIGNSVFLIKDNTRVGPIRIKQLKFRAADITQAKAGSECGVLLESTTGGQKLKLSAGQNIIAYQS